MKFKNISFIASNSKDAQKALKELKKLYKNTKPEEADVIVPLGGDGLILNVLETYGSQNIPIFGMNRGTVGFLTNKYSKKNLLNRLNKAEITKISPLTMEATNIKGIIGIKISLIFFLKFFLLIKSCIKNEYFITNTIGKK